MLLHAKADRIRFSIPSLHPPVSAAGFQPGGRQEEARAAVGYAKSDLIEVQRFTRQPDGEEVVIGLPATNVFLALPAEAVEILDGLARGKTVGETQAEFALVHGVEPDLDDLLQELERRGFVRPRGRQADAPSPWGKAGARGAPRFHFTGIPQSFAKRLFGPFALTLYLATIAAALAAAVKHPSLVPGRSSLIFSDHRTLKLLMLFIITYGAIFLHELAHLLAAKARGVESRIGISNRLWVLVAETDMTGLWSVPSRQRYLPMLAGPLLDGFTAALLFLFLVSSESARADSSLVGQLIRAFIFMSLFRLLWQCFFFVRTDFYYVFTTFFGCKNLMKDTVVFLKNLFLRVRGSSSRITDQSHIPLRERRVIRMYSVLWLLGRVLSITTLVFIILPVAFHYLRDAFGVLRGNYGGIRYQDIDSLVVGALNLLPLVIGMSLWIMSIARKRGTV